MAIGVYPGSFNPPTLAHVAVARAALDQCGLTRVDLVLSRHALGKDAAGLVRIDDRRRVLEMVAASRPWLGVRVTDHRLIADIAGGYDVVVLGADKWNQLLDPSWYGDSPEARDAALDRLPRVACAPRPPHPSPAADPRITVLDVHEDHHPVSATEARAGRHDWMLPEAAAFDARTGAWSDPARYAASSP